MPPSPGFTLLDAIDLLLILSGGVVLGLTAMRWGQAWPRDPLRGAPIRLNVLSAAWLWLALLAYAVSILLAGGIARLHAGDGLDQAELEQQRLILAGSTMQILLALAMLWIMRHTFVAGLRGAGLGRRLFRHDVRDALRGFLVAFSLSTTLAWLTEQFIRLVRPSFKIPVHTVLETLDKPSTPPWIAFVAIVGAFLLAPIAEELLFRGILQTGLRRAVPPKPGSLRHRWVAILLASVIFGFMHWPLVQHIPALIVLAIVLGYLYERTGSLAVPIFVHIVFNGKTLLWNWLQHAG